MNKAYIKRLQLADSESTKAQDLFEKLEGQFLAAAQQRRQVYDDIVAEIERLEVLRDRAMNDGMRDEQRAKRVRELFL